MSDRVSAEAGAMMSGSELGKQREGKEFEASRCGERNAEGGFARMLDVVDRSVSTIW